MEPLTPFSHFLAGTGPRCKPGYVYVASSWRNPLQVAVVAALRSLGIVCYDYRSPAPGKEGFSWRDVSPSWEHWTASQWREALSHRVAKAGFGLDRDALERADAGVLVLPCGRSAHLEAGWLAGRGVPVFTLALEPQEPELMTLLLGPAKFLCTTMDELYLALGCDPDPVTKR
jgi:hypothetical protein